MAAGRGVDACSNGLMIGHVEEIFCPFSRAILSVDWFPGRLVKGIFLIFEWIRVNKTRLPNLTLGA